MCRKALLKSSGGLSNFGESRGGLISGGGGGSLGPVHTYADIFENASFFIRFGISLRLRFRSPKTKLFENALQSGSF